MRVVPFLNFYTDMGEDVIRQSSDAAADLDQLEIDLT